MLYFDNAATSFPKPPCVAEAMVDAIRRFGNPSRGGHEFAMAASREVERARALVAGMFGCCSPARVVFTKNATEALNIAIGSVDGRIVSTEAEHNSVLRPLYRRGDFGIVPVDAKGRYGFDAIAAECGPGTAAVVVAHASNVTGNLVPLGEIGRLCRERGMLFIVDAAQTAGLVDIDMERDRVDALCFTGHKSLYGPQGTGGICLGERFRPRPLMVGGSGSRTFDRDQPADLPVLLEVGTQNAHGIAGLAAGAAYVMEHGPEALRERAARLAAQFVDGVRRRNGVVLYGDIDAPARIPVVSLNIGDMDSAEAAAELAERFGMAVRGGAHCAPLLHTRFGTEKRGAVRFSFSHFNTDGEIEAAIAAVATMAAET